MDRDGTINVEKGYIRDPAEIELIPNAAKAIKRLNNAGFTVFGISNQSGVARGYFSLENVREVNRKVLELLSAENAVVREILFCPHHPQGAVAEFAVRCGCRKPAGGMVEMVREKYSVAISESIVVGDKICDIEMGKNIGARTVLVQTGYGKEEMAKISANSGPMPDFYAKDLWEATRLLLNGHP